MFCEHAVRLQLLGACCPHVSQGQRRLFTVYMALQHSSQLLAAAKQLRARKYCSLAPAQLPRVLCFQREDVKRSCAARGTLRMCEGGCSFAPVELLPSARARDELAAPRCAHTTGSADGGAAARSAQQGCASARVSGPAGCYECRVVHQACCDTPLASSRACARSTHGLVKLPTVPVWS